VTLFVNRRSVAKLPDTNTSETMTGTRQRENPRKAAMTSTMAIVSPAIKAMVHTRDSAHIPEAWLSKAATDTTGPMLKAAAREGRQIQTIPTMGSAKKQRKYQRLGARPTSDITTNHAPPMMNSGAPIARKTTGFDESMAVVIISTVVNRHYHTQRSTRSSSLGFA